MTIFWLVGAVDSLGVMRVCLRETLIVRFVRPLPGGWPLSSALLVSVWVRKPDKLATRGKYFTRPLQ
ncbi:hypothetical protein MPTK1_1g11650 [Marchantia polymorpha subsp. ruderalis]|uniref:Uncharacterized protein n=2 Tax=Marchantia polymorpha TaxID=3197 RepID=A0AAF6AP30_MARPO|nr:hypothetical protein MARPO_0014s0061 [Marchantia polymorpha]BBM98200.1 hypothetical protein Mp_1g11650 [Marchantia polymorpha subsp. ruderalis]|eukprot:PTQ45520.1 hypothetical protein MARPO_0014s0061 [Marchantia polymorpha]